jgi:hypothetical protein
MGMEGAWDGTASLVVGAGMVIYFNQYNVRACQSKVELVGGPFCWRLEVIDCLWLRWMEVNFELRWLLDAAFVTANPIW